jgi:hypothetical protein
MGDDRYAPTNKGDMYLGSQFNKRTYPDNVGNNFSNICPYTSVQIPACLNSIQIVGGGYGTPFDLELGDWDVTYDSGNVGDVWSSRTSYNYIEYASGLLNQHIDTTVTQTFAITKDYFTTWIRRLILRGITAATFRTALFDAINDAFMNNGFSVKHTFVHTSVNPGNVFPPDLNVDNYLTSIIRASNEDVFIVSSAGTLFGETTPTIYDGVHNATINVPCSGKALSGVDGTLVGRNLNLLSPIRADETRFRSTYRPNGVPSITIGQVVPGNIMWPERNALTWTKGRGNFMNASIGEVVTPTIVITITPPSGSVFPVVKISVSGTRMISNAGTTPFPANTPTGQIVYIFQKPSSLGSVYAALPSITVDPIGSAVYSAVNMETIMLSTRNNTATPTLLTLMTADDEYHPYSKHSKRRRVEPTISIPDPYVYLPEDSFIQVLISATTSRTVVADQLVETFTIVRFDPTLEEQTIWFNLNRKIFKTLNLSRGSPITVKLANLAGEPHPFFNNRHNAVVLLRLNLFQ